MMKYIKYIILTLTFVIVLLLLISFFLPGTLYVKREIIINAPIEFVYKKVSDFNSWKQWSPWYPKDTTAEYIYQGIPGQGGHSMHWKSENGDIGKGSLQWNKVVENSTLEGELSFENMGTNSINMFRFEGLKSGTKVTWIDSSQAGLNPMFRWFGLFMDQMVGPDFEDGLRRLKTVSEK